MIAGAITIVLGLACWFGLSQLDVTEDSDGDDQIPGADVFLALPITGPAGQTVAANFPPSARGPEPPPTVASALWWTWTAPRTGIFTFATHGSEFDTILRIFSGSPSNELVEIATNDDDGDVLTSSTSIEATGGETYYVEVIAKEREPGLVTLTWDAE